MAKLDYLGYLIKSDFFLWLNYGWRELEARYWVLNLLAKEIWNRWLIQTITSPPLEEEGGCGHRSNGRNWIDFRHYPCQMSDNVDIHLWIMSLQWQGWNRNTVRWMSKHTRTLTTNQYLYSCSGECLQLNIFIVACEDNLICIEIFCSAIFGTFYINITASLN